MPTQSLDALADKYGLIFEGSSRLYVEDLSQRDFNLEHTTPRRFSIHDMEFEETSWGELIRLLTMYLFEIHPELKSDAVSFRTDWSKQSIFTRASKTNAKQIDDDLWINCNNTALHSCWLIQDLLDFFGEDKTKVRLIIHRPPSSEPPEIKEAIRKQTISSFKDYLIISKDKTEESADKIVANILNYLNPMLAAYSNSYNDFFLFDSKLILYNYSVDVRKKIGLNNHFSEKGRATLNRYLDYLVEFYKVTT